jgi:transglutaminase-like putative cysteine protease
MRYALARLETFSVLVVLELLFIAPVYSWDFAERSIFQPLHQDRHASEITFINPNNGEIINTPRQMWSINAHFSAVNASMKQSFSLLNNNGQKTPRVVNSSIDDYNYTIDPTILKIIKYSSRENNSIVKKTTIKEIADLPYVFGENPYAIGYTSDRIKEISASSPDLIGVSPIYTTADATDYRKEIFNARVEPQNPLVHDSALKFAGNSSGAIKIEQICSIYNYLRFGDSSIEGWVYKSDPRVGGDYLAYANETLKVGEEIGCTGTGDCDDFAILLSALVESIGGTTRIISACGKDGRHAYTEVYLGQLDDRDNHINGTIHKLKQMFGTDKIYTHINTTSWDVWLNLDWQARNPGGPFFPGDSEEVVWINDLSKKTGAGRYPISA